MKKIYHHSTFTFAIGLIASFLLLNLPAHAQDFPAVIELNSLDGTDGYTINGSGTDLGWHASAGGDLNGDGFDDIVVAPRFEEVYVIFGGENLDSALAVVDLNGSNGFTISGSSFAGSVAITPDINGDGIDDLMLGGVEFGTIDIPPFCYVIFGDTSFGPMFDLTSLNGTNGFVIEGFRDTGIPDVMTLSGAGDYNGDGHQDILACQRGDYRAGICGLILGAGGSYPDTLSTNDLDGTNGFKMIGRTEDSAGRSLGTAGDINNDGYDDFVVGAPEVLVAFNHFGEAHVIFGEEQISSDTVIFNDLDGTRGFRVKSTFDADQLGIGVSTAGDINHDGFDDLLIGAPTPEENFQVSGPGQAYIIYGTDQPFPALLNPVDLDGTNGFAINGIEIADFLGRSVSDAGDPNGDGIDDIIIGAPGVDLNGVTNAGAAYVVFGKSGGFGTSLEVSDLDGTNGFAIHGTNNNVWGQAGYSVSTAGDINNDNIDDILIGAQGEDQAYVIYGRDLHAMNFDENPKITDIQSNQITLEVIWGEKGTVYYSLLTDGSTAPSAQEIIDGVAGAAANGSILITEENVAVSETITGLQSSTPYDAYLVAVDELDHIGEVDSLEATTATVTGIVELPVGSFKIYPNPGSDILNIELPNQGNIKSWNLRLQDVLGRYHALRPAIYGPSSMHLDISHLSSGFYVLTLDDGRYRAVQRIMKK